MKKIHKLFLTVFVLLLLIIIITPHKAFNGALLGLKLWAFTVLPGLFPAALLSSIVLRMFPMKKSFVYIYIILAGLLCGFPVGGILIASYCRSNEPDPMLMRIMPLCNISSPSFMLNYVFTMSCFQGMPIINLLLCTYLPVFICLGILIFYEKKIHSNKNKSASTLCKTNPSSHTNNFAAKEVLRYNWCTIIDEEMERTVKNMLKLGGYIVIFSCISCYIHNILYIPEIYRNILCGIAEITNGIFYIDNMKLPVINQAACIMAINAFGGISTLMQTIGIGREYVPIKKYIFGKLMYAAVTILMAKILLG